MNDLSGCTLVAVSVSFACAATHTASAVCDRILVKNKHVYADKNVILIRKNKNVSMSLPAIRTTPEQPHWYPVNHEQRFGLYGVSASLTTIAAIAILTLAPSVELMVSSARAPKTLVGNIIVALTLRLDIKSTVLLLLSLFVCTFLLERGAPRCCRKSFTW